MGIKGFVLACILMAGSGSMAAGTAQASAANQPREFLFFAFFDCSWKNAEVGPTGPTTVRKLYEQFASNRSFRVHAEYVTTDCARDNWFAAPDGGRAVLERQKEAMHKKLTAHAMLWGVTGRAPQINVVSVGGSWGGAQAAAFSRMVHERGIPQPAGLTVADDGGAQTGGFLTAPGASRQVVVLLDPVGTMVELPESVVSGLQLVARDEKRPAFRSMPIIPQNLSADRRLLGLTLPGSHSDICGGYTRDGLAIRTANMVIDYINRLSADPLLRRMELPSDPAFDVIHNSEQERL